MPQLNEKQQVSIYKLKLGQISLASEVLLEKQYSQQEVRESVHSGFATELFYARYATSPKWKGFLGEVAIQGAPILELSGSSQESFVLLLERAGNVYAVVGGSGYFAIQDIIEENFGIDIFVRLATKDAKVIKSTKEKSLVGGVLGVTKHFRNNYNLFENESFGNIYQELKAALDKEILRDVLGFSEGDLKREMVCIAKSSFSIKKAITFNRLLEVITGLESILQRAPVVLINSVRKINNKSESHLVEQLKYTLNSQLWDRYSDLPGSFASDLCNREFEPYLTACYYEVRKGNSGRSYFGEQFSELRNIDQVFEKLSQGEDAPNNLVELTEKLESFRIIAFDADGNELTKGDFYSHILGDVELEGKKFFYIEKCWYQIEPNFISKLNDSCAAFIGNNFHNGQLESWDLENEDEGGFNLKHIGLNNTLVLDRVTPDNIESCDIMRWDENTLYLYHVKASFGNTMRDLCSQVFVAANRIQHDRFSDKAYINSLYDSMVNKIGGASGFDLIGKQTQAISREDFLKLFEKRIVFVLSVLDVAENQRDIRNPQDFGSNIAKFSIHELATRMRGIEVPLEMLQITRGTLEAQLYPQSVDLGLTFVESQPKDVDSSP